MKHLALLTAASAMGWLAFSNTAFADDCERNQALLIDHREGGTKAGEVKFLYDSRVEKFSSTARKFAWCIEADSNNQNIAEFHWGDAQHEGKYLNTLIEPGRSALSMTTDTSQKIEGQRTIRFRRKNKSDWGAVTPATLSSRNFGFYSSGLKPIFAQANSPAQPWPPELEAYRDQEGLIEIERLSANKSLFLKFLEKEQSVYSGGSLLVTLPVNNEVADLIASNKYENYNSEDFVRAHAELYSLVQFNKGLPLVAYVVQLLPEGSDKTSKLFQVVKTGNLKYSITGIDRVEEIPVLTKEPKAFSEKPSVIVTDVSGPIKFARARLEVKFGNYSVASFTAALYAPQK
jgi:hypothetical protein